MSLLLSLLYQDIRYNGSLTILKKKIKLILLYKPYPFIYIYSVGLIIFILQAFIFFLQETLTKILLLIFHLLSL